MNAQGEAAPTEGKRRGLVRLGIVAARYRRGMLTALLLTLSVGPGFDVEEVRALVLPSEAEDPWASLPWRTSLWQARHDAAAEGKPILLWEMDGHPLGCT